LVFTRSDHVLLRLRLGAFLFFPNLPSKSAVSWKRMTASAAEYEGTKENEIM